MSEHSTILELRLFDNALDFINKSMESYLLASEENRIIEYKYAILFLANGVELILKSILEDKHPLFIKESLDKNNDKTVSAENLVTRINTVYNYETPKKFIKHIDRDSFEAIREIRNNIIHKDVVFQHSNHPEKLYARTLFSLDKVVRDFKGRTLSHDVPSWHKVVLLEEIKKIYHSNVKGIVINNIEVPCALCGIKKLINKDNKINCFHCGTDFNTIQEAIMSLDDELLKEELFNAFIEEKKSNGCTIFNCPKCDKSEHGWFDPKSNKVECFECGFIETDSCSKCKCNSLISEYDEYEHGLVDLIKFCLLCEEYFDDNVCPCCFKPSNSLYSVKIDVRKTSTFSSFFPHLEYNDGPFITTKVCVECHSTLIDLEEKKQVTLL
ncbi:hypothetical protein [Priestia flexa]|uniref:Uncharacterized protein n=1 Tax=Priestia flexa TaxID=86664 RepID=A0A8I1SPW2_9BACI|nr:hypothetical protein [Priestia flexa]MBN8253595.1 hypothetical protein [Priestia flexa]